jgi:hypothetical protein
VEAYRCPGAPSGGLSPEKVLLRLLRLQTLRGILDWLDSCEKVLA